MRGRVGREKVRDPWADLPEQEADSPRTREERRKSQVGPSKLLDKPGCPKGGCLRL